MKPHEERLLEEYRKSLLIAESDFRKLAAQHEKLLKAVKAFQRAQAWYLATSIHKHESKNALENFEHAEQIKDRKWDDLICLLNYVDNGN